MSLGSPKPLDGGGGEPPPSSRGRTRCRATGQDRSQQSSSCAPSFSNPETTPLQPPVAGGVAWAPSSSRASSCSLGPGSRKRGRQRSASPHTSGERRKRSRACREGSSTLAHGILTPQPLAPAAPPAQITPAFRVELEPLPKVLGAIIATNKYFYHDHKHLDAVHCTISPANAPVAIVLSRLEQQGCPAADAHLTLEGDGQLYEQGTHKPFLEVLVELWGGRQNTRGKKVSEVDIVLRFTPLGAATTAAAPPSAATPGSSEGAAAAAAAAAAEAGAVSFPFTILSRQKYYQQRRKPEFANVLSGVSEKGQRSLLNDAFANLSAAQQKALLEKAKLLAERRKARLLAEKKAAAAEEAAKAAEATALQEGAAAVHSPEPANASVGDPEAAAAASAPCDGSPAAAPLPTPASPSSTACASPAQQQRGSPVPGAAHCWDDARPSSSSRQQLAASPSSIASTVSDSDPCSPLAALPTAAVSDADSFYFAQQHLDLPRLQQPPAPAAPAAGSAYDAFAGGFDPYAAGGASEFAQMGLMDPFGPVSSCAMTLPSPSFCSGRQQQLHQQDDDDDEVQLGLARDDEQDAYAFALSRALRQQPGPFHQGAGGVSFSQ